MKNNKNGWVLITIFIFLQLAGLFILSKVITAKTDLLVKQNHQLTAFVQKDSNLIKLEEDYQLIIEDIEVLDQALPNKEKIIDFISQLEQQASASGLLVQVVFNNQSVKSEADGAKSISFNLNLSGTYFAMVNFTQRIEAMPQVIRVERITIQSPEGIEKENKTVLNIKVYIDPDF